MSGGTTTLTRIDTLEIFLAHALTLEIEAAEAYKEIGDAMAVHNNPEVSELFKQFARYGWMHVSEVKSLAEGLTLPHIAPWDFVWENGASPEAADNDQLHYMMAPAHALQLAIRSERRAHDFYQGVADTTTNERVRTLATQFAEEEAEHERILREWVVKYPAPEGAWDLDLDPPGMPE